MAIGVINLETGRRSNPLPPFIATRCLRANVDRGLGRRNAGIRAHCRLRLRAAARAGCADARRTPRFGPPYDSWPLQWRNRPPARAGPAGAAAAGRPDGCQRHAGDGRAAFGDAARPAARSKSCWCGRSRTGGGRSLFKPARQAVPGRRFALAASDGTLECTVVSREGPAVTVEFDRTFDPATVGSVPLPPYIRGYSGDPERYQTVYGRDPRSAAAPTAGLHFTAGLLAELEATGVERAAVTLEVGPGTFKPVTVDDPREHGLHAEHVTVGVEAAAAIRRARDEGRRVVAIGTTVIRTLEHVARERGGIEPYEGWTSLRILPGDEFRVVDAMVTNFHLPRSTLLMLVCAFAGPQTSLRRMRRRWPAVTGSTVSAMRCWSREWPSGPRRRPRWQPLPAVPARPPGGQWKGLGVLPVPAVGHRPAVPEVPAAAGHRVHGVRPRGRAPTGQHGPE